MKKFKVLIFIVCLTSLNILSVSCKSSAKEDDVSTDIIKNPATADSSNIDKGNLPAMTFQYDSHDFGEIIQDEIVTHNFQFTNTGKSDLLISNARASCGCTVPEYPKEPVKPGKTGIIKVTFDSKNKKDAFNKTVTITANTYPNENKLQIKGIVIVPSDK
ncbi:MAG: DUF1573 domain-containing protein [Fimbriimonadaceae bacterium]|nr:DUF1573 domain-containing protein [Chitinophagales bacterium]